MTTPQVTDTSAAALIARTLNAIAACDQVVMIDHGRVAVQGTHADLMAKSSAYRDLARRASERDAIRWECKAVS